MIEAVGHEYMEEFFGCCESVMANDGLLVLQVCVYTTIKLLLYLGYIGMIFM
jgi:cyclopropane fatty-acyl-phospholipid synthase-like methyltransferase